MIGLTLGLLAGLGISRLFAGLLYGVDAADPVVFFAVPAVVLPVALLGCWLPILRATRVDPMSVLRSE